MHNTTSLNENYRFRLLYNKGSSSALKTLAVYVLKSKKKNKNQIGITVSKKLGKAVARNRMRRRLKEAYRINESRFATGFDIVIVARRACHSAPFEMVERDLLGCLKKLGVLKNG